MKLFTKKVNLFAPTTGQLKVISEAKDELFASKAMGDGFLIEPNDSRIYAPIEGKVTSIFPTKHAIGLESKGLDFLLHMGINTVELNGEGFEVAVAEGDTVTPQTLLATMDLDFVRNHGMRTDIMLICTNLDKKVLTVEGVKSVIASQKVGIIN